MGVRRTLVAEFSILALVAALVGVSLVGAPGMTAPASADPAPVIWASSAADPSTGQPDLILGQDFAPNTTVTVTVNAVAVSDPPTTDDSGEFWYDGNGTFDLNPGDLLAVSDGATTKDLTLAGVTVDTLNYGTGAAAGSSDQADGTQVDVWAIIGTPIEMLTATVAGGTWTADFTTDISQASAIALIFDGDGDVTTANAPEAPGLQVLPEGDVILGRDLVGAWPDGETVAVEIDDPVTPANPDYTGVSGVVGEPCPPGPCGPGGFALVTAPYDIKAGDVVTAEVVGDPTIAASHVVQPLSVTEIDYDADTVTGTTAPGNGLWVANYEGVNRNLTADGAGNWAADFSVVGPSGEPPYDLTPAEGLLVAALPVSGPGQTAIWTPPITPSITVTPDTGLVDGQTVAVDGENWKPGLSVGFSQCKPTFAGDFSTVFDDCMQLPDPAATVGPDLTFSAPVAVHEVITTDTGPFDCTADGCRILAVHFTPPDQLFYAISSVINFSAAGTCDGLPVTVDIGAGDSPTENDDVIGGTNGPDNIDGLGGNDTICGRDGDDVLAGDAGDDTILGGAGNDTLKGQQDNDTLFGGSGNDLILGNAGDDVGFGEGGVDDLKGGSGIDTLDGGADADEVRGGSGNDVLTGGTGDDVLNGGQDLDTVSGGIGDDTVNGAGSSDPSLNGDEGNDLVRGGNAGDTLNGGPGDDLLLGVLGADTLNGGPGNDDLRGGDGTDDINGDEGDDDLRGGNGTDDCDGGTGGEVFGDEHLGGCETITNIP